MESNSFILCNFGKQFLLLEKKSRRHAKDISTRTNVEKISFSNCPLTYHNITGRQSSADIIYDNNVHMCKGGFEIMVDVKIAARNSLKRSCTFSLQPMAGIENTSMSFDDGASKIIGTNKE